MPTTPLAPAARPALLRELDAIVHEKFFGRCAHELIRMVHPDNEDDLGSPAFVCTKCKKVLCGVTYYEGIDLYPCYSTNIAAAWSVIDKWNEHGWHWEIESGKNNVHVTVLTDNIDLPPTYGYLYRGIAPTAPLAICFAALQAAGEDASRFEELLTC